METKEDTRGQLAIDARRARLSYAHKILLAKKRTHYKEAVAVISFNLGITDRKAREYIDTLLQVDGVRKEGDFIVRGG
jgi:hypothetical protein